MHFDEEPILRVYCDYKEYKLLSLSNICNNDVNDPPDNLIQHLS